MDDDESTVRAVVEAWLVDNPNSMVALVEAVKTQNVEGVTRLAHTMKGSASVISANALAQAALPLELAGRKGELANADTLLADIQMEFDKLKAFLSQCDWIDRAKTGS